MFKVEMTGFVCASAEVRNLNDLRELISWCDKYHVRGDSPIDYGTNGRIYLDVLGTSDSVPATWIECGDHLVDDQRFDVLLESHQHPEHKQEQS